MWEDGEVWGICLEFLEGWGQVEEDVRCKLVSDGKVSSGEEVEECSGGVCCGCGGVCGGDEVVVVGVLSVEAIDFCAMDGCNPVAYVTEMVSGGCGGAGWEAEGGEGVWGRLCRR